MGLLQSKRDKSTVNTLHKFGFSHYAPAIGVALVIGGILLFIDQKINSGWIPLSLPLVSGVVILAYGHFIKNTHWLFAGYIITAVTGPLFLIFQPFIKTETTRIISYSFIFFSLMWLGLFLSIGIIKKAFSWWILFVITISLALSTVFYFRDFRLLVFIFAISLAISFSFIIWGAVRQKTSLMIPGLLVGTIGAGVFSGWSTVGDINGLRDTGVMLVWFSLGWILISVFSRIFQKKFTWWPLIPGGVFAMVGSGLYIGGNPANAAGFLQNTGSIALIILGCYLILLKFGLKK